MTMALLPAAGHSRRMGRPKLSLPLGGGTILGHTVAALRRAAVDPVLVVVGPHVPELAPLAEAAGGRVCRLAAETADMRATVAAGLDWLEANCRPRPEDWWLLVPADHPTLDASVVAALLAAARGRPDCSVVVPTFQGQRGHPALIAWRHVAGIRALPPELGLNTYLRSRSSETLEVDVATPAVLADLDTADDYQRLLKAMAEGT